MSNIKVEVIHIEKDFSKVSDAHANYLKAQAEFLSKYSIANIFCKLKAISEFEIYKGYRYLDYVIHFTEETITFKADCSCRGDYDVDYFKFPLSILVDFDNTVQNLLAKKIEEKEKEELARLQYKLKELKNMDQERLDILQAKYESK